MLIIFDLDDTLVDTWSSVIPIKLSDSLKAMQQVGLSIDFNQTFLKLLEINKTANDGLDAIKIMLEQTENQQYFPVAKKEYNSLNEKNLEIKPLDGAIQLLDGLNHLHTLTLVSKGIEEIQLTKLNKVGISKNIFKAIIFTQNYNKKECYQKITQQFSVPSSQTIVVGDKYKSDLLPAKELGMITVHMEWGRGKYQKPKIGQVDYSIQRLAQLQRIIDSIQSSDSRHISK
jgi:FMN phosphatase YigB (HAD superfamily)